MNDRSAPTSTYSPSVSSIDFDDEEVTSNYGDSTMDELPPLPVSVPSGRSFDALGSLLNFDTQDAFRNLYGYENGAERSLQIAAASHQSDHRIDRHLPPEQSTFSSRSASIEIEVDDSPEVEVSPPSSAPKRESQLSFSDGESIASDAQHPAQKSVLWWSPRPLLSLRDVSLQHGQSTLFSGVNLDIAKTGLHIVVCEERPCRRLLLSALSSGARGAMVRLDGHIEWYLDASQKRADAKLITITASELLLTIENYLQLSRAENAALLEELFDAKLLEFLRGRDQLCLHDLEPHERRAVSLLRGVLRKQPLLCMDDPLEGLSKAGGELLVRLLSHLATRYSVLITVPDLGPFQSQSSKVIWHIGERMQLQPERSVPDQTTLRRHEVHEPARVEEAPSRTAPHTTASEEKPKPRSGNRSGATSTTSSEPKSSPANQLGPRGFRWLVEGKLAGTPEPGLLFDIDYDLSLLRAAGITMLVTLTEHPLPDALLEAHGLKSLFFPIVDMNVPSCRATEDLCALVEMGMDRGEVIAFHCKAGLGRTGTLLVSYLIWEGAPPSEALEVARSIEPGWVQSEVQEQYLFEFARYCSSRRAPTAST